MENSVEWEGIHLFALLLYRQSSSSVIIIKAMKRTVLAEPSAQVPVFTSSSSHHRHFPINNSAIISSTGSDLTVA